MQVSTSLLSFEGKRGLDRKGGNQSPGRTEVPGTVGERRKRSGSVVGSHLLMDLLGDCLDGHGYAPRTLYEQRRKRAVREWVTATTVLKPSETLVLGFLFLRVILVSGRRVGTREDVFGVLGRESDTRDVCEFPGTRGFRDRYPNSSPSSPLGQIEEKTDKGEWETGKNELSTSQSMG